MKNIALAILLLSGTALAGTSAATATITDTDSQTWNNGSYTATLSSPGGSPTVSGTPVTATFFSGKMNGSGVLSVTLTDTSTIDQSGAKWVFVICPNASSACGTISTTVVGATPSLSTVLSAGITAPRFNPGQQSYGYLDKEVLGTPVAGAQYFQVTCGCMRSFSTTNGWSGASGGAPSGSAGGDLGGTYPNPTVLNVTHVTTGVLGTANGGTGASSFMPYNPAAVAITGGTVDGTIVGGTTAAAVTGTVLAAGSQGHFHIQAVDTNYNEWTTNGVDTDTGRNGCIGRDSSADNNMYCNVPSTGTFNFNVNNVDTMAISATGATYAGGPIPFVAAAPTANQAVCIKAAGPPVQLGTCSTVVGAGGACTCN